MSQAAIQFREDFEDVQWAVSELRLYMSVSEYSHNEDVYIRWDTYFDGTSKRTEDIAERHGGGDFSHHYRKDGSLYGTSIYGDFTPVVE